MQTTRLNARQLGGTGLEITGIGFGAWACGGFRRADPVDPILAANLHLTEDDLEQIGAPK